MIDWKRKLSSRKFWVCICGLVSALFAAFSMSGTAEKVTAIVMALGSVVSYILAEGFTDAAAAGGQNQEKKTDGTVPAAQKQTVG